MDSFCIDKDVTGTEKHFLCRGGTYSWVKDVPEDVWYLGNEHRHELCLLSLAKLNRTSIDLSPPQRFVSSVGLVLHGAKTTVPWRHVMPKEEHRMFVKRLVEECQVTIKQSSQGYYRTAWVPGTRLLKSIKKAKVSSVRYKELIELNEGNVAAIRSFAPRMGGYADLIVYNRFGTRTGRLTVLEGPQLMTIRKDHRNIIESRYGTDGSIVEVDFANLEPRIMLYEAGKDCKDVDLYGSLNERLFAGKASRDVVKGVVISELYGMQKTTLQRKLQVPMDIIDVLVERMKSHFETSKLLQRVKSTYIDKGYILNAYGRCIDIEVPIDRMFINSYAQSTGVDVALMGFEQVVRMCEGKKINPIGLITDAMLLDVHNDDIEFVKKIERVQVTGYRQSFPLKLSFVR